MFVHITGTGSYLPEHVVTNDDLAKTLDTSDEWIFSHTGIHSRHIAAPNENTSDMAIKAAKKALASAGIKPEELGTIIVATSSGDYQGFPTVACLVQEALGATQAGAMDLQAACTGFIYSVQVARGILQVDQRPILVVGADMLSRIIDWKDRNTCILFGDAAGAAVLEASPTQKGGIEDVIVRADGKGANLIYRPGGTKALPGSPAPVMFMNGRAVFNFAVKIIDEVLKGLLERSKHVFGDLAYVIPHQANGRILEAVARRMGEPLSKFYVNMVGTGNTSAASIPVALDTMNRGGMLKDGDLLAAVGFGAGLAYGGFLMQWAAPFNRG